MAYNVQIKKQVLKMLVKLNEPHYSAIKKAIYELENNPRPQGYLKLKNRDGYRIRVGSYRIIYDIFDQELFVEVITLGHRKDIYD